MTIITLAKKVKAMREVQKQYFSTRSKKALIQSKELEKQVDQAIAELEHLQMQVPGNLEDALAWVKEQMTYAEQNVNIYRNGLSESDGFRVYPNPNEEHIWRIRYVRHQTVYNLLTELDRLQRKLNQMAEL